MKTGMLARSQQASGDKKQIEPPYPLEIPANDTTFQEHA
jgi:hypothetical protein